MGGAIERAETLWDDAIAEFLAGDKPHSRPPLSEWFSAYRGRAGGEVVEDCFPEPFLGDLHGAPRAVLLALNPGPVQRSFQTVDGVFAEEIRAAGSYTSWAKTWPYLRPPWGRNRHHERRQDFLRKWFGDADIRPSDRVDFELYPWHSAKIVGAMRPAPTIIRELVIEPALELRPRIIFAFGCWWWAHLAELGLEVVARLGDRGALPLDIGYRSGCRQGVAIAVASTGTVVIAEKHSGPPAGPPGVDRVDEFREQIAAATPLHVRDAMS